MGEGEGCLGGLNQIKQPRVADFFLAYPLNGDVSMRCITPSHSAVAAREGISGVFRKSLKARGLRLVARSVQEVPDPLIMAIRSTYDKAEAVISEGRHFSNI